MAHIALVITGLSGKLHASYEMAFRLEREGHNVTYLCPLNVKKKVENQGFVFLKIPEINFAYVNPLKDTHKHSWISRLRYQIANYSNHYKNGLKNLKIKEYEKILKQLAPDHVLIDMEIHDLILPVVSLNIPITLFTTWFSDRISSKLPHIRSSIVPGQGVKGSKLGILFSWIYFRSRFWAKVYLDKLTFKNHRRMVLNRYAREVGILKDELLPNNFPPIFSYKKLPIVTIGIEELEFPHRKAKNISYAGPMVSAKRDEVKKDTVVFKKIEELFEEKKSSNKKIVYCSLSTFTVGDTIFLSRVIKAFEKEKDWVLILSLGSKILKSNLPVLPENVYCFDWVPQLKALSESDLCINHGGINTIYECIHFGVPMLVYSGKNFDQNGSASRIYYHGLGLIGDKDVDDSETIRKKIVRVLSENSFKSKTEKFKMLSDSYRTKKLSSFLFG